MPHARQQHEPQQAPMAPFPPYRVDYRSTDHMVHANHHPSPPWMRVAQTSPHHNHHPSLMIHQIRSSSSVEDHHYRHAPAMATVLSHDSASSASSSAKRERLGNQVTASVLMLAKDNSPDDRSRPLKKRKTFASHGPMPCHVSPVSSHADDRTHVTQYSREEDDDTNSRASAVVPHFPSVLHMLLTVSKDGVLEWLEHGKAWRIVRWEALRRAILPQFFPQLQSMDAFLAHISAWGFREVTEGPDVGAYTNEKFRRDTPELCRDMVLPNHEETPIRQVLPKVFNSSPRSILRVPSLSTGGPEKGDASGPTSGIDQSPHTPEMASDRVKTPSGTNNKSDSTGPWDHMEEQPVFVNYRSEGMSSRPSTIMPPYSPISIQSGRGRRSFFVSNRGRGVGVQMRSLPMAGRSQRSDDSIPPHPNSVSKED